MCVHSVCVCVCVCVCVHCLCSFVSSMKTIPLNDNPFSCQSAGLAGYLPKLENDGSTLNAHDFSVRTDGQPDKGSKTA